MSCGKFVDLIKLLPTKFKCRQREKLLLTIIILVKIDLVSCLGHLRIQTRALRLDVMLLIRHGMIPNDHPCSVDSSHIKEKLTGQRAIFARKMKLPCHVRRVLTGA